MWETFQKVKGKVVFNTPSNNRKVNFVRTSEISFLFFHFCAKFSCVEFFKTDEQKQHIWFNMDPKILKFEWKASFQRQNGPQDIESYRLLTFLQLMHVTLIKNILKEKWKIKSEVFPQAILFWSAVHSL